MGNSDIDLIKKAKRLCTVNPPSNEQGKHFCHPMWLSEYTLLAHTQKGDGFFAETYRLDTRTGRVTFLPQVDKQINTFRGSAWKFSSDKEWFLYLYGTLHNFALVAVTRDGRQVQRWKLREPLEFCEYFWLPGTHQWMEFWGGADSPYRPTVARLYRLGRTKLLWERKLPAFKGSDFIGYGPTGEAILAGSDDTAGEIHVVHLPTAHPDRLRQETISVGKGRIDEWQLTPDKKRLVFRREHALWIVGLDGRGLRRLGNLPKQDRYPLQLAGWQPKTDALVLYYQRALYRVPGRMD